MACVYNTYSVIGTDFTEFESESEGNRYLRLGGKVTLLALGSINRGYKIDPRKFYQKRQLSTPNRELCRKIYNGFCKWQECEGNAMQKRYEYCTF